MANVSEGATRERDILRYVASLAAAAAHEINNPLAVVMGYVQLLADGVDATGRRRIDEILKAGSRIQEIVIRMKHVTRIELTNEAATDAVVEAGAPGSTSAKTSSSKSYAAGTTIDYQANVSVTVDLDVLNGQGQDAFPNATGKFNVTANGTVNGNGMNGTVT